MGSLVECAVLSAMLVIWGARPSASGQEAVEEKEEIVPLPVAELSRTDSVSFAEEVFPILKRNCIPCHSASKAKAKLVLESPQTIAKGSSDGEVVVKGKAMESLLFLTAAHRDESVMPPENNKANARNLTPDELALLKLWIDQGATGEAPGAMTKPIAWEPVSPHIAPIYGCAVSGDKRFVAFGRGNRLFVYDVAAEEIEAELVDPEVTGTAAAHRDLVQSLAFSRDGLLASGGFRTVKLWQREASARVADLDPPSVALARLAGSGDGDLLLAGGKDGEVSVWNPGEMETSARRWRDHGSARIVAIGPGDEAGQVWSMAADGTLRFRQPAKPDEAPIARDLGTAVTSGLDLGSGKWLLGLPDGKIRLVGTEGETPVTEREWAAHSQEVAALIRQGEDLAVSISAAENQATLWRISDGSQVRVYDQGGAINGAAAAGAFVATTGANHTVKLWKAEDGTMITEMRTAGASVGAQAAAKLRLDIATARRDAESKELGEATKKAEELVAKARESAVAAAKASDAARKARGAWNASEALRAEAERERDRRNAAQHPRLASAEEALKTATDAATQVRGEFDKLEKEAVSAARNEELARRESVEAARAQATADSASALAGEAFARATDAVAEVEKQVETASARDVTILAFNAEATRLAGALTEGVILIWATKTGALLEEIPAAEGTSPVSALRFRADGGLVVAREDRSVAIWEIRHDWKLRRKIGDIDHPEIFPERVNAVAFDGDGGRIATGSGEPSRGGDLKIWDVASGELLKAYPDLHSDSVLDVVFSPDGSRVLTTGADRFARIVSLDDVHPPIGLEGHAGHVLAGAWRADGKAVATAGADKVVKLWNPDGGGATQSFEGYGKEVTGLCYVGFHDQLLSASGDGSVRLGNNDRLPNVQGYQHVCASSADGQLLVAGGEDGILRGWLLDGKKLIFELKP